MYLRENEYEQLCKTCPFLRKGYTNVCGYGAGCYKQDKLEEIKAKREASRIVSKIQVEYPY